MADLSAAQAAHQEVAAAQSLLAELVRPASGPKGSAPDDFDTDVAADEESVGARVGFSIDEVPDGERFGHPKSWSVAQEALSYISKATSPMEERIDELLRSEIDRWSAVDSNLSEPLRALHDLVLSGGKRLRPAFCYWAFVGAGGDADDPRIIEVGAALELLHTWVLIHDDVMDGSATRRGTDTIHVQFEAGHALEGWRGEARRFGEGVAILVGDLALVYADLLLSGLPRAVEDVFNELRIEVNVGQYLDLLGGVRGGADENTARRIARFKSGKYTVERPLHIGAALGGRLDELAGPLSAYGLPLGEALQLRDDLLGVFGDEELTGKPVGEDLREGKPTLLYALAIERASREETAALARYGAPELDNSDVAAIQAALLSTGAVDAVERAIDDLVDEALQALANIPIESRAREVLAKFAILPERKRQDALATL